VDSVNIPVSTKTFDFDESDDYTEEDRWKEEEEILTLTPNLEKYTYYITHRSPQV